MAVLEGSSLSAAELVALVEGPAVYVDGALDLLDSDDNLMESDIEFVTDGSSVERGIFRTIHGTATLNVGREIAWGSQRLRPWLHLSSDGETWYRFPQGVFLPTVPERVVADDPPVWSVSCLDKLDILNVPVAATVAYPAGTLVTTAVAGLITAAGESKVAIDFSLETLSAPRVFSVVDDWTRLGICNALLDDIGFQALHVDVDGWYRSSVYRSPDERASVWSYNASDPVTTTVAEERSSVADYYRAANQVTGIIDAVADAIPTDSDGIYTLTNNFDGPTSVTERGGRIIPRKIAGQYTSQAALILAVREILDNEKRVTNYVTASVSPTPVHGHFDVVNYRDDDLGVDGLFLVTDWTVPFDGSDCSLSLRGV